MRDKTNKRPTEQLNLALAGIESTLSIIASMVENDQQITRMIKEAQKRTEEIREALLTIQDYAGRI